MNNPDKPSFIEVAKPKINSLAKRFGNTLFTYWNGYSIEESQQFKYWGSINDLLIINDSAANREWVQDRQAELLSLSNDPNKFLSAYSRARLENYCRRQNTLPDGRVVIQLPAFGVDRADLQQLGILTDNYIRNHISISSDDNFTVILPEGWTMRPADTVLEDGSMNDPLRNSRFAGVYDDTATQRLSVFYNHKPFPFSDDFKSRTRVTNTDTK